MRGRENEAMAEEIAMRSIGTGEDYEDIVNRVFEDQGCEDNEKLKAKMISLVESYLMF